MLSTNCSMYWMFLIIVNRLRMLTLTEAYTVYTVFTYPCTRKMLSSQADLLLPIAIFADIKSQSFVEIRFSIFADPRSSDFSRGRTASANLTQQHHNCHCS